MGWGRNASITHTSLGGQQGIYIVTLKKEYKAMPTSENRCCVDKIT